MFCVDGTLHYNPLINKVIYVFYYRNQYAVMDTMLNLLYRGPTIDSISHAKIKVTSNKEGTHFTKDGQSVLVNRLSYTYKNLLFINSMIPAKNEDKNEFAHSARIDIYNLDALTYSGSFYIAEVNSKKMQGFVVQNSRLFALFDKYLVSYDLTALLGEFGIGMRY